MSDHWWLQRVGVPAPSDLFDREPANVEQLSNTMLLQLATDDGRAILVLGDRRLFNDSDRVADNRELREFAERLLEAINTATREMS